MRPTEQCLERIRVRARRSLKPITLGTTQRMTGVAVETAEVEEAAEVAAEAAEAQEAAEAAVPPER
jgi:hypothetical protein